MPSEQVLTPFGTTLRWRFFEKVWLLLWELALGRLRREPTVTHSVAERKILQNLIKILQIPVLLICFMGIDFVRFWIDFVGFLPVRASQERNYSSFASQKQCFHHLKTVFLPPKTHVFGVQKRRFRESKKPNSHNMFIINDLPNPVRIAFLRPKGRLVPKMPVIRVKRS